MANDALDMNAFQILSGLIGGLGIFLLAMKLMTDGLKLASGDSLKTLLGRWTSSPLRGVLTGAAITAFVQSSSAVTVATIGFVNAGIMRLYQAIGVIYGTNVGTTMTAWLVAALGFQIKVETFALPMIGVGMGVWFLKPNARWGALGQAIGGFGFFFLGIDILKTAFETLAPMINLQIVSDLGVLGVVYMVGAGFLLTLLTQSSSAAIALTLTAAAGGVVALPSAAALVIGANIGTTSTAMFAALNATSNAKRVATAHVIFNVVTGIVALLTLPLILFAIDQTSQVLRLDDTPAVALALFHSMFNVIGVALMWPWTKSLSKMLANRFRTSEETLSMPRYLDKTVAATPTLALNALFLEIGRIGTMARTVAISILAGGSRDLAEARATKDAIDTLDGAVREFASELGKASMGTDIAEMLPDVLRLSHYYAEAADMMLPLSDLQRTLTVVDEDELRRDMAAFLQTVNNWTRASDPQDSSFDAAGSSSEYSQIEDTYHRLKDRLLRAGLSGQVPVHELGNLLDNLSALNRALKRFGKAGGIQVALSKRLKGATENHRDQTAD